ncbi:hypothetical protein RAA17_16085 [Komagataeibacter rhaeticus]|nr:hypothetical protein [Komagataeibacter rhaeticus]
MAQTVLLDPTRVGDEIPHEERPRSALGRFLSRIGIPPALAWGFAGVLIFMTGTGWRVAISRPTLSAWALPNMMWPCCLPSTG